MEAKKALKLIDNILSENSIEAGIFISFLSKKYIEKYQIPNEKFLTSLKNSLEKLQNGDSE